MSDAMESLWQGVLQETPQEFEGRDTRGSLALSSVVFEAIGDGVLVELDDLAISDGWLLCISSEVADDIDGSFRAGTAVDDPFFGPFDLWNARIDGSCPFEKDGSKDLRQGSDVEEELAAKNAEAMIGIDHERRNQDVDMRMPDEGASPGMKCGQEPESAMEILECHLLDSVGDGTAQSIQKFLWLLEYGLAELGWDSEGHVEIRHRQDLVGAFRIPHVELPVATGRTQSIPAGVWMIEAELTIIARHRMATHQGSAARKQIGQCPAMARRHMIGIVFLICRAEPRKNLSKGSHQRYNSTIIRSSTARPSW
jgi:hypothetical protein